MPSPITVYDEDTDAEVPLPTRFEVCPRCHGKGAHVNPAVDGNGITESEMTELEYNDEDFREKYLTGFYDVSCEECGGLRVTSVIDEERCTQAEIDAFRAQEQEMYDLRAEEEAERRAGC